MHFCKSRKNQLWVLWVLGIALLFAHDDAHGKDSFQPFKLKTTEGRSKTLKDYLNKATLVTFFFPTCSYCNAEFPHLQKIYDRYGNQGLSMVSINIVPEQTPLIATWQKEHQYTFPVLVGARMEDLEKDYDLEVTPTHFLLDSQGKVLLKQDGYKPGDEKLLEAGIAKVLGPVS